MVAFEPGGKLHVIGPVQGADKQYSAVSPAHKHWLIHILGTMVNGLPAATVTCMVKIEVQPQHDSCDGDPEPCGLQSEVSLET